jgi:hypothetical protein
MNLYFLVEGLSESEFYPKFVEYYLGDLLSKVNFPTDAISNNYYLIGNGGYPFIYTGPKYPVDSAAALKNAILDVNNNPVFNYLIICLDADEMTIDERINEFNTYIQKYTNEGVTLNNHCEYTLIVQNKCIETWFLGNRKMYKKNPSSEPLISYSRYYNVSIDDPELMGNFSNEFSPQDFHHQYLREMIRERTRKSYKKETPMKVIDVFYLDQLHKRISNKNAHLASLINLVDLLVFVNNRIKNT